MSLSANSKWWGWRRKRKAELNIRPSPVIQFPSWLVPNPFHCHVRPKQDLCSGAWVAQLLGSFNTMMQNHYKALNHFRCNRFLLINQRRVTIFTEWSSTQKNFLYFQGIINAWAIRVLVQLKLKELTGKECGSINGLLLGQMTIVSGRQYIF